MLNAFPTFGSIVAQLVKNPPAMRETWLQSLGWEYPLENRTATHSSILALRIPWTEQPGRLQSMGDRKESDMTERLSLSSPPVYIQLCFILLDQYSHKIL